MVRYVWLNRAGDFARCHRHGGPRSPLVIFAAILLGLTLPITPVHILWVNRVAAVTLSQALAFEAPEVGVMKHPPCGPAEPLLNIFLLWRIFFVSCLMVAGAMGFFTQEEGTRREHRNRA